MSQFPHCPPPLSTADYGTVSEAGPTLSSLRHGRPENRRLVWALVLSLTVHLLCWGAYELGQRLGWWDHLRMLAWLHHPPKPTQPPPPPAATDQEPQLSFLEVAQPDAEAPKKPKFYSNNNSHAANPDADQNLDTPKLTGKQTDVPKIETARRTQIAKTPNEAQPAQPQNQSPPSQPAPKPGDLARSQPQNAEQQIQPPHPPRPRTLKEALAQQPSSVAGVAMRQAGGVHRVALRPSFDAEATAFGDYDAQFVQAIEQKWYDLLDNQAFADDRTGHVTLHFHQNFDGTVTEITTVENTVGPLYDYLCLRALTEPSPFAPWPEDMRRLVGGNFRDMTFTFYYY